MNIDLWLENALKKVKESDPIELIKKLEQYGLVEPKKTLEVNQYSGLECYSLITQSSFDDYCDGLTSSYESGQAIFIYEAHEETEFKVAPLEAAHSRSMDYISSDLFSQNIFSQAA